jgi:subfamily B ATP-binding cassette protein MsbA
MFKKFKENLKNNYTVLQLRKMWPFIAPYKARAALTLLLAAPLGALDAVIAWSLKPFMDSVMVEKSVETAMYIPFVIVGFAAIQSILTYSVGYLNSWVGNKITFNLQHEMYKKLIGFDSKFFDNITDGDILARFSGDVNTACRSLLNSAKLIVVRTFSSVSLIFVLFYHSWQLALVAIFALVISFLPLKTYRRRIKDYSDSSVVEGGRILMRYQEASASNKVVKLYTLERIMSYKFIDLQNKLFRTTMKITQRSSFLPAIMSLVISCGIAVIIWFGSYLIVNGEITGGAFVSFIAALILLYNPLKRIGQSFAGFQSSLLAMERIFEYYEQEYEIKNNENALELKGVDESIELKNVCFSYDGEVEVLKDISITAKKGQTVALVGNSGGGKSTIVSLLPRLYDVSVGEVLIDGKNIKDYTIESLRKNISVVLQDNFLFNGTIRGNTTLFKDYSDEKIRSSLESACLDEFVDSLECGVDTQIGYNGSLLSGGQRQRVAIARAFLKNSPILILDEATSALDNKSEKIVQQAMENLMKDRTVFVIAHRLTTVQNADKIVVINNGKVMEEGSHNQLLEKDGYYASLYKTAHL